MDVKKEYRFEKGAIVADWECPICRKVIYPETNIRDVPPERLNRECERCEKVLKQADEIAEAWWEAEDARRRQMDPNRRAFYHSSVHRTQGMYGLRDDLVDHLAQGRTSKELQSFAKRAGVELPLRGEK
jgi:hypothetical protein